MRYYPKILIMVCLGCLLINQAIAGPTLKTSQNFLNSKDWGFLENKGQLADEHGNPLSDIRYYGQQGGVSLYCRQDKISFLFTKTEKEDSQISEANGLSADIPGTKMNIPEIGKTTYSRADMILAGANLNASIVASEQEQYYENYYLAHTPAGGITHVHSCKTLTYKDIYPNIDMVLHASDKGMKYEFVIKPGGRINDIQIQWNGLDKMQLAANGNISYSLSLGELKETKPISYQGDNEVLSTFNKKDNTIGFKVDKYDHTKTLVIDPMLSWATYYGGDKNNDAIGLAIDSIGNIYFSGPTNSGANFATTGAYKTSSSGAADVFIVKIDSNGKRIWGTYYGGDDNDNNNGLSLDAKANIYITGYTLSTSGIASSSGVYQSSFGGQLDAYLAKFDSSGFLYWSTYYGGSNYDKAMGVSTDPAGNVYIAGYTSSVSGVATSSAFKSSYSGSNNSDAFLAKFSSSGSIIWATYYGGSGIDNATSVVTDISGNVYITGTTQSNAGIATSGTHQLSIGGNSDVYIAKFDSKGSLLWGSYYGGTGYDYGSSLAVDPNYNVYITGSNNSNNGITTSGAYITAKTGGGSCSDAFLAKFDKNGALSWGTYYGGNYRYGTNDAGTALTLDNYGNIYLTGFSFSDSGIATNDAIQKYGGGGKDVFFAKFNNSGYLSWATYCGDNYDQLGNGVATDRKHNVYFAGYPGCQWLTSVYGSGGGEFLAKFYFPAHDAGITSVFSPRGTFCPGTQSVKVKLRNYGLQELDSVKINWSVNRKLQKQYKWTGKMGPDSIITITLGDYLFSPGKDTIKAWTSMPNGVKDSVIENDSAIVIDSVNFAPHAFVEKPKSICIGKSVLIQTLDYGGSTFSWSSKPTGFKSTQTSFTVNPTVTTTYYLTETSGATGCSKTDSIKVTVNPLPIAKVGAARTICNGTGTMLGDSAVAGYVYSWFDDRGKKVSNVANPVVSSTRKTNYVLQVTASATGCYNIDSVNVYVNPSPAAVVGSPKAICAGAASVSLGTTAVSGNTYLWKSNPVGNTYSSSSISVSPASTTMYYLTETITATGCSKTDSVMVTVNPLPTASVGPNRSICIGNSTSIGAKGVVGNTYKWSSNTTSYSSSIANPTVSPMYTTIYTLSETVNATGCNKSNTVQVTVHSLPDAGWSMNYTGYIANFHTTNTSLSDSSYHWALGDNFDTTGHDIKHLYPTNKQYTISLRVNDGYGCSNEKDSVLDIIYSGIASVPLNISACNIYPNPFQNTTVLEYELQQSAMVNITLYDVTGRQIGLMAAGMQMPGKHRINIDADKLGLKAGLYNIRLTVDDKVLNRNIIKIEK